MTIVPIARRTRAQLLAAALLAVAMPNGVRAQEASPAADSALARQVRNAKVSLGRGLSAASARGTPISAKYEIEDGKLQLSVYTAKSGRFWEVVVNHRTGGIGKAEEIKEGDDLTAAKAQHEAMAKAKRSLASAVNRALKANPGSRAVSVAPAMQGERPVASISLASSNGTMKTVSEPLD